MGNLNCIHRMGHKTVTGELNHLCLKSEEKGIDENGRNYFSSFKIFDRQRSSKSCRDSKEDREGNNACPLCKSDKTVINGEQDDGDQDEDITSKRYQSLLQPPFKALSTPGDALIENEVILLKVCNCSKTKYRIQLASIMPFIIKCIIIQSNLHIKI